MPTNRLHLDFALSTNEERANFIREYLAKEPFITRPPTPSELETIGNYLLWGKDPITGLNAQQEGLLTIETKNGTWNKDSQVESLDGLLEQPTFNEASLSPLGENTIKVNKEVFSREEALEKCPPYLIDTFKDLFRRIDEIDLGINYYDLAHGKRKNPPRPQLLHQFTAEEQVELRQAAEKWPQYHYLKQRHQLVELRREQYTLRDSYSEPILLNEIAIITEPVKPPQFDCEIEVLPLGIVNSNSTAATLIFQPWEQLIPKTFSEEDLKQISDFYWEKKKFTPGANQFYFDFRNLEHVYQVFLQFFELDDAAANAELESTLPGLMETLEFYIERAELSELHKEILDMKLRKKKNTDIAIAINKKWNKSYTPNYISTIFRQRIIPKINAAAEYHEKIISNVFFEEEFKTCSSCGRTLLLDADNFMRRSRSKDGFSTRCKKCEKESRNSSSTKTKL